MQVIHAGAFHAASFRARHRCVRAAEDDATRRLNADGTPTLDGRMRVYVPEPGGPARMIVTDSQSIWGRAGTLTFVLRRAGRDQTVPVTAAGYSRVNAQVVDLPNASEKQKKIRTAILGADGG